MLRVFINHLIALWLTRFCFFVQLWEKFKKNPSQHDLIDPFLYTGSCGIQAPHRLAQLGSLEQAWLAALPPLFSASAGFLDKMSDDFLFVTLFSVRSEKPTFCHNLYWNSGPKMRNICLWTWRLCVYWNITLLTYGPIYYMGKKVMYRRQYFERKIFIYWHILSTLMYSRSASKLSNLKRNF